MQKVTDIQVGCVAAGLAITYINHFSPTDYICDNENYQFKSSHHILCSDTF